MGCAGGGEGVCGARWQVKPTLLCPPDIADELRAKLAAAGIDVDVVTEVPPGVTIDPRRPSWPGGAAMDRQIHILADELPTILPPPRLSPTPTAEDLARLRGAK